MKQPPEKRDSYEEFREYLKNYGAKDRVVSSSDAYRKERSLLKLGGREEVVLTKTMPLFDEETGGFRPGEVIVISGGTSEGKTLLMSSWIKCFSMQDYHCLVFSYEMPLVALIEQMGGLENHAEFYTPAQVATFKDLPFADLKNASWYLPNKMPIGDCKWIWLKAVEMKFKGKEPRAIFIDHLHYLVPFRVREKDEFIGDVMRSLVLIARDLRVTVFLVAHTKKDSLDSEPKISDARGSSFIVQEPDMVFFIWQEKDDDKVNNSKLKMVKHRRHWGSKPRYYNLVKDGQYLRERDKSGRDSQHGDF